MHGRLAYNFGCLAVLSFFFSAIVFLIALQHANERVNVHSWRLTPGVITKVIEDVHTDREGDEYRHYSVMFSYAIDGVTYTAGENTFGSKPYNVGDRVRIRYSGRSPYEVRLDEEVERKVSYHVTFAWVLAGCGIVFAAIAMVINRRRQTQSSLSS